MVALVHQDKKSRSRLKVTDFLLRWTKPARQSQEEQLAIFRALAARSNARDDR